MLSPSWPVHGPLEISHHHSVSLYNLSTPPDVEQLCYIVSKQYRSTPTRHHQHYIVRREHMGVRPWEQGAGLQWRRQQHKPKKVKTAAFVLSPEFELGLQSRLESKQATPTVTRP
jgi:hypothetical protein